MSVKGKLKNARENIIVAPGYEKTLSRVFMYHTDITDLKNKEKQLQAYQYHLENMVAKRTKALREEMERRIEFTKILVHEMKTPLTPLMARVRQY